MRVVIGRHALKAPPQRAVVTVGMFDGVHIAHQRLIRTTVRVAKQLRGASVLITFHPDPQEVLDRQHAQPRLMSLETRLRLIKPFGIDVVWVIPFTKAFSAVSAEQFVRMILYQRLHASCVVVGEDFAFGRNRRGHLSLLRALSHPYGIRVVALPPVLRQGIPVSSSRIRQLVTQGELEEARRLLGRPVALSGTVVRGNRRGRTLGFPTANIRLTSGLLPPHGVYQVWLDEAGKRRHGLMNVGVRPTFGTGPLTCEVHLVGFRGNLYGKSVSVSLVKRLRDERRFDSPQALAQQLHRDVAQTRLLPT